jgi:hypothetical protein
MSTISKKPSNKPSSKKKCQVFLHIPNIKVIKTIAGRSALYWQASGPFTLICVNEEGVMTIARK